MRLSATLRRRSGFTIVELLVTIALLALVLMTVIPSMSTWARSLQVRNTAESIQTGLQRARSEAVNRNRVVRFTLVSLADNTKMDNSCQPSVNGISWVISIDDPTANCGVPAANDVSPRIITSKAGGDGGSRTVVTASGDPAAAPATTVIFDNYGRLFNNVQTVQTIQIRSATLNDDARALNIVVSPSGSVRMCDPAVTATTDPRRC